ncbi:MAG: STAS domain-containing protein [Myxococcales bacterium]|nr:STAS domain-containing protein [Myxococcales bacterium]
MTIANLEERLAELARVLEELGLGNYDAELDAGDDALGAVEEGVNGLVLDLEALYLTNAEKERYLELQQRSLDAKEAELKDKSAALVAQMATIEEQRALLDAREVELQEMLTTIDDQTEAIRELSVPIIEVEDGVVALPVIGAINGSRARELMERLLEHIVAHTSRHVILDMTGVSVIDTGTAHYIENLVAGVHMLGARCVISGLNSATAQTLTGIGTSLGGVPTFRSLKEGLRDSLRLVRARQRRRARINRGGA